MADKIKFELVPYDAMAIYKFLSEFEEEFNAHPQLEALRGAYLNYKDQLLSRITSTQLDDAFSQVAVNRLLGKDPD